MLSPIFRTYVNPDLNEDVATVNIPHVMHYAPNVSNADVGAAFPEGEQIAHFMQHGRWKETPGPFVIQEGVHGFFIQFLGVTERDAINKKCRHACAALQDQRGVVFATLKGKNAAGFR